MAKGKAAASKEKAPQKKKAVGSGKTAKAAKKIKPLSASAAKAAPKKAAAKAISKSKSKSMSTSAPMKNKSAMSKQTKARGSESKAQRMSEAKSPNKKPASKMSDTKMAANKMMDTPLKMKPSTKKGIHDFASFFSPLDDRILVRRSEPPEKSRGGIILSASGAEKPNEGEVVAVGRGRLSKKGHLRPLDVQLGDKVLFAAYGGSQIMLAGVDLLVLRESDILGIYE